MKATISTTGVVGDSGGTYVPDGKADIELHGTWDTAQVDLEKKTAHGDWEIVASYTEDTFDVYDGASPCWLRYNVPESPGVGGSTSIKGAIGE